MIASSWEFIVAATQIFKSLYKLIVHYTTVGIFFRGTKLIVRCSTQKENLMIRKTYNNTLITNYFYVDVHDLGTCTCH